MSTVLEAAGAAAATETQTGQSDEGGSVNIRQAINDDGTFAAGWTGQLGDEIKELGPSLAKFTTVQDLAKGYANAAALIGRRTTIPGADAKPEDIEAFRKANGIPENPDGYGIEKPKELPEGVEWNDDFAKGFAEIAHRHHVPPAAVKEIVGWYNEQTMTALDMAGQRAEAHIEQEMTALRKAWGGRFEQNLNDAKRTAATVGLDVSDPEIGNSAKIIQALAKMASFVSEDRLVSSDQLGLKPSPKVQADSIMTNPDNPWYSAYQGKEGQERQREAAAYVQRLLVQAQ